MNRVASDLTGCACTGRVACCPGWSPGSTRATVQENVRFPDDTQGTLKTLLGTLPPGSVVDLAPGQYEGPLAIDRPVTLRGAGELTRIFGRAGDRPISVSVTDTGRVVLESLRLERGDCEDGGGLLVSAGDVHMRNIHIHQCTAVARGGAMAVTGGRVAARQLNTFATSAERGGSVWVGANAQFKLRDGQMTQSEALYGGALAIEDSATVEIDRLTVSRSRARSAGGGQAVYVAGGHDLRPVVRLHHVRIENGALGLAVVISSDHPAEVRVEACDMPRSVRSVAGVVDGGANHWR